MIVLQCDPDVDDVSTNYQITVQSTYINILYIDISLYQPIFKFLNESISYLSLTSQLYLYIDISVH